MPHAHTRPPFARRRLLLTRLLAAAAGLLLAAPAALADTTAVIDGAGAGTNRIEVTGNTASGVRVRCDERPTAAGREGVNVNSVNIDRRALAGRTVIVTGRNSHDVEAGADCRGGQPPAANVNSVNIH